MLFKDYKQIFIKALKTNYPQREINNILRAVAEDLVEIPFRDDRLLTPIQINQLESVLDRLKEGEPVQYVTQIAHFYGYKFKVGPEVLIPRPETEGLIYSCISKSRLMQKDEPASAIQILDIGTGSGCIAIVLKKENLAWDVWAIDNSGEAIALAKENAKRNMVSVNFREMDIFNKHSTARLPFFDIIISNPPYIPISDKKSIESLVVDHEPFSALFVQDTDPLKFYRQIIEVTRNHLRPGGLVCVEINEKYGNRLKDLFKQSGFGGIELSQDLQGKDRYIIAVK